MKLLPQTLLGRTALLIAFILVLSQVASTMLFRFYYDGLRAQRTGDQVIANLGSIGAALTYLPAASQPVFLQRLTDEQGVRVLPGDMPPAAQAPRSPPLRDICNQLRERYGNAFHLNLKDQNDPVFWVRLAAAPHSYWIGMPLNRVSRGFPWPRVQWLLVGGLLSLLGAYLVVWRINLPLRQLAQAAGEIGKGKLPLLVESGPEEIRSVCRAFNQMGCDVQQLDRDRNLLLAGVSHDLRTPLARLRLAIEMLETRAVAENGPHRPDENEPDQPDPPLTRLDLDRLDMIQDIEDMDLIIRQFLAYVRHGTDEVASPGDLNRLIGDLVDRLARPGQPIQLHLSALPDFSYKPLAMQRLLSNLLENAVLHGSPDVEVSSRATRQKIVIEVLDRGPGIPAEERQRVLQPFTQLAGARFEKGAGLGLAIVDRIVRLHGGEISLLDRKGGGLAVRLEFLLAP